MIHIIMVVVCLFTITRGIHLALDLVLALVVHITTILHGIMGILIIVRIILTIAHTTVIGEVIDADIMIVIIILVIMAHQVIIQTEGLLEPIDYQQDQEM
jgi:hypothetical protein